MEFSLSDARLSAARRRTDFAALRDNPTTWDLIVIGGGVTGAGTALDAASRGMSVLLVEAHDLAFGTSRWSSKLAHGGLRYLGTGHAGVALRSAAERGVLMERTAPHLTRALSQVVPLLDSMTFAQRTLPALGFLAGDMLRRASGTSAETLPRPRYLRPAEVQRLCPTVETKGLRGGLLNVDGQLVDDARLVTALARTAAGYGATVLTYARASAATGDSVELRDELAGPDAEPVTVAARAVVNATGVWAGELQTDIRVRPSRGTHVVVRSEKLGNPEGALTVPVPGSTSRYCFILPQELGRCFIGLTDVDQPGEVPDIPDAPTEDVEWVLDVVNRGLGTKLTLDDVAGAYAGLRPLISMEGDGDDTSDLSRDHAILTNENGLITVTGGKLTEYRLMAEETVDKAIEKLGASPGTFHPCSTKNLPLVGADRNPAFASVSGADLIGYPESMVRRFGRETPFVVRSATCDRPLDLVAEGIDITRAEFEFSIRNEGVATLDDLLDRRYRLGLVAEDRAAAESAANELFLLAGLEPR